jgi:hypothetical protein
VEDAGIAVEDVKVELQWFWFSSLWKNPSWEWFWYCSMEEVYSRQYRTSLGMVLVHSPLL